jgi:hypothetical protein
MDEIGLKGVGYVVRIAVNKSSRGIFSWMLVPQNFDG